ncbi:MAG TPA: hypothetical protein VFR47_00810 [Anaerolineales bacterium]|nr:hypothetical protein [Anaerolineales bacterium]
MFIEYAVNLAKTTVAMAGLGEITGVITAYLCGGDIAAGARAGFWIGAALGSGGILAPEMAAVAGAGLGAYGLGTSLYDMSVNGITFCNLFNALGSVLLVKASLAGLATNSLRLIETKPPRQAPSILFRGAGAPAERPTPKSPAEAQALIDLVVKTFFDDLHFRRKFVIKGKVEQFITSSEPRFPPEYDPSLPMNHFGASEPGRFTKIGPRAVAGGPFEILRTIIHEEIHHWLYEQGYSQLEVRKVENNVDIYLLLIMDGWSPKK